MARDVRQERLGPTGSPNMTLGLWLLATGALALSFECLGAALVLWGIGVMLIRLA